jgi:Uma2 family endonuclease
MNSQATKLTYQDYLQLPEDGKRYEIMDGELYMIPAPMTRHQIVVGRLHQLLMNHFDSHPIGMVLTAPTDVLLCGTDIVQPDLLVILSGGAAVVTDKNIQGPPNVVIEVLSTGTAARDRVLKVKRYEHFGVREYWLVDPDANTLEILALAQGRLQRSSLTPSPCSCTSPLLPDLIIDLGRLLK